MTVAPPISKKLSLEDIAKAIAQWEESVKWIAHGWDCEDEYWDDLSYRERLDELVAHYVSLTPLSKTLRKRISRVDERFKQLTEDSQLCIWHTGPQFGWIGKNIEACLVEYDPDRYWYYYRWPPDAPYPFREYGSLEFQRYAYGLDFESMTVGELMEVKREHVAALYEVLGRGQKQAPSKPTTEDPLTRIHTHWS